MAFKKATKEQAKGRIGLIGPAGSGKSYSALRIACAMGKKVAAIDTEHGSLSKYANDFSFDVDELSSYHPQNYINAIKEAERHGYDVLVIDSLSHAWSGKDGALELKDRATANNKGNSFSAWREITPLHNALIEAILSSKMHIIATMRAKTEYVLETNERGKQTPRRVGTAPVQRDGMEYEFDIVGDLDLDNTLTISKSRCKALKNAVAPMPGEDIARTIMEWLTDGAVPESELRLQALTELGNWAQMKGVDGSRLRKYGAECPDINNGDPKCWTPEQCKKLKSYIEFALNQSNHTDLESGFDPANQKQVARIHILQQEKAIPDTDYRRLMAETCNGKSSSKMLTVTEANAFIQFLEVYITPTAMGISDKAEETYPWDEPTGAH
jgi:hypothetical protein